jgi:hypothetical protein
MVGLSIPNIDDLDHSDVIELQAGFRDLERYCDNRARAIHARLQGNIQNAMAFEAHCETLYKRLPQWAKW